MSLHDTDREWELLAVMLDAPKVIPRVMRVVEAEDFGEGATRRVYDAIVAIFERGATPDPFLVRDELADPKLAVVVVDAMRNATVIPGNAVFHAQRVHALAMLRKVQQMGVDLTEVDETDDPAEVIERMATQLRAAGAEIPSGWGDMADVVTVSETEIDATHKSASIVSTGFPTLDHWLDGGFHPGRLYVLGARTSVGKSALATNMARHALSRDQRVLFVSLEMSGREVLTRLVSDRFDIDHRDIPSLVTAWSRDDVQAWPLAYMGRANVSTLSATARELRPQGLRLIIVDYVQLLPSTGKFERRDLEIGYITRALKLLAVELGLPVLALSQVNRAGVHEDTPPQLHHLRESGNLEQDANVVMLLHRLHSSVTQRRRAVLAVAKNRHGPEGGIHLGFTPERTRFHEITLEAVE